MTLTKCPLTGVFHEVLPTASALGFFFLGCVTPEITFVTQQHTAEVSMSLSECTSGLNVICCWEAHTRTLSLISATKPYRLQNLDRPDTVITGLRPIMP